MATEQVAFVRGAGKNSAIIQRVRKTMRSSDPKHREAIRRCNAGLVNCKLLTPGAVHNDATLSRVSVQYKNEVYIGTRLMPIVPVGKLSDKYYVYNKRDRLAAPDDTIGPRGRANEVNENRSTDNYSCESYALKCHVDGQTIANQDAPLNEMLDATASVNDGLLLNEEIRIATIMTTAGNYGGNTAALAAADRLDSSSGGNPTKLLQDADDALWMGNGETRKVLFMGNEVWKVMARHPVLLDLFKYNKSGLVKISDLMEHFDIDEVLIGKARRDTANEGQSASYSRIWGKQLGLVRVASDPGLRQASFGYTLRFGDKKTSQWFDPDIGAEGGYYTRTSMSEDHKVVAADTGWLWTTVIN